MMRELLRRIWKNDYPTPEDVAVRVENVEERSRDIHHDLYVIRRRADILKTLVREMHGEPRVQ